MRTIRKALAILMALALLAAIPVITASAEIDASVILTEEVLHSITVEESTGNGLAFLFTMNIRGASANSLNEFVADNAIVEVGDATYSVVKMGAVLTNRADYAAAMDTLTLETVNGGTIIDIPAQYLCAYTDTTCSYAVRIIHIPAQAKGFAVACRPYIVLADENGNETTVYGGGDISTFYEVYYRNNVEEIPVLDVTPSGVEGKLAVTASSTEYVAWAAPDYKETFRVAVTLENVLANGSTADGDWVEYTCYDADGNALATERVTVGALTPGASVSAAFYAPMATASIEATASNLSYAPAIVLPAIGSDIDVVKQKNRIRVSATSAAFNADGTIAVSLTFKNRTSNWITEETDYVVYTCYDADGNSLGTGTIYIGCIDTKKHPEKTFNFNVPANTAEVKITNSKIVYWTEWS